MKVSKLIEIQKSINNVLTYNKQANDIFSIQIYEFDTKVIIIQTFDGPENSLICIGNKIPNNATGIEPISEIISLKISPANCTVRQVDKDTIKYSYTIMNRNYEDVFVYIADIPDIDIKGLVKIHLQFPIIEIYSKYEFHSCMNIDLMVFKTV